MTARHWRALAIFGAFATGVAVVFGAIVLIAGPHFSGKAFSSARIGGPFSLTDQNGRTITEQDLKGKPFLVFFGFTHCPDTCPTTLFDVSEVLKSLGPDADRTAALFITVDPERDNAASLKDYLSSFDPHLVGLTGDTAALATVAREYRVYYKKVPLEDGDYTMDHTAIVYLMDKEGRFVSPFNLKRKPEASAEELRKYL